MPFHDLRLAKQFRHISEQNTYPIDPRLCGAFVMVFLRGDGWLNSPPFLASHLFPHCSQH